MVDFDNNSGGDVVVVRNGESNGVWIDGEKVYEHDELHRNRLMRLLNLHTNGKISSYQERGAVIDLTKEDYTVPGDLPEDINDIVFSGEVETAHVRSFGDIEDLESESEYLIVKNFTDLEERVIRQVSSVEIWDIQNA